MRGRPREPQRCRPGVWHCSTDQKLCFVFVESLSRVPTLCDPMDCSTPGFPVLQHLLELAQTHIHWISDATQPSHPLFRLLLPSIYLTIGVFPNELALPIRWPKYWSFNFSISSSSEYSELISFRKDWFDLLSVEGTLWCSAFFMIQFSYPYMATGYICKDLTSK